jgi:hypothetical protein
MIRTIPAIIIWSILLPSSANAQNALWIDLSGDWHVSADDRPEYAQPAFDDSQWRVAHLPRSALPERGIYWVRRTATLPDGAVVSNLALTLGTISEIYELFVNGNKIGGTGRLAIEDLQVARPRTFLLPAHVVAANQPIVVAVRLWRTQPRLFSGRWTIYDRGPYLLTYALNAPKDADRWVIAERWVADSPHFLIGTVELTLVLLILLAWMTDRPRHELLWLALFLLFDSVQRIIVAHYVSMDAYPNRVDGLLKLISGSSLGFQFELCLAAARFRRPWLRALGWLMIGVGLGLEQRYLVLYLAGAVLLGAMAHTVWSGAPRIRLVLPALLLAEVLARMNRFGLLGVGGAYIRSGVPVGGFYWDSQGMILVITAFGIAILLFRDLLLDRREKQRLAGEVEAARAVQQLLFPAPVSGNIEAVYRPALEVGGDFWQAFPIGRDSQLVVVGDVSGKGLKAAMVVSVLTGALRNRQSNQPSAILSEMNRVAASALDGGFVTAAVARIDGGHVTIANAGHPSPSPDGVEVATDSGLPLGIDGEAEYSERNLAFRPGEQLTFVSDGVTEAANANGELFGFDRTCEISAKPAAEIAEAAHRWGQNDDITVVTVRRMT